MEVRGIARGPSFLAGTDWGTNYMSRIPDFRPGVSAVEDVMLLGEALSPLEGLRAMHIGLLGTEARSALFAVTSSASNLTPSHIWVTQDDHAPIR
jgi:hypothetical protein